MVSRLPVFSGKKLGMRVPPEMVLPVVVLVVLSIVVLITFPWQLLTIGTLAYLAALPLGLAVGPRLSAQGCRRGGAAAAGTNNARAIRAVRLAAFLLRPSRQRTPHASLTLAPAANSIRMAHRSR